MNIHQKPQPTLLYCSQCQRHTPHENIVQAYATACTVCGHWTNQLMRLQSEEATKLTAPDGTAAIVVENTPDNVTFYIPTGEYQGYYHHDKHTGENRIAAG